MKPVYFDYSASTPLLPKVLESLVTDYQDARLFANPSSRHSYGVYAKQCLEEANHSITSSLGLADKTLVATSSSTESIHLAILGALEAYPRPKHVLLSWTHEHSATLGALKRAHAHYSAEIILISSPSGRIDLSELEDTLRQNSIFMLTFSIVHQELGILQDYMSIIRLANHYGTLVHIDASSTIGKVSMLDLRCADFITLSSHKCFGPKGIAALYINSTKHRKIRSIMLGGPQQYGLRPGTENAILLRAMAHAYRLIHTHLTSWLETSLQHQRKLQEAIIRLGIQEHASHDLIRVPHIVYVYIPPDHQTLWLEHILCSQGSACNDQRGILSPALLALKLDNNIITHSYRISHCHMTTDGDIERLIGLWETIFS